MRTLINNNNNNNNNNDYDDYDDYDYFMNGIKIMHEN